MDDKCANCGRAIIEERLACRCRKCEGIFCQHCFDTPAGLCWVHDGVGGAAARQREMAERERSNAD